MTSKGRSAVEFVEPGEVDPDEPDAPENTTGADDGASGNVDGADQQGSDATSGNGDDSSTPLVRDLGVAKVVPIDSIRPAEKNPRKIPQRAVEIVGESLKRFGWQQPLVVDSKGILVVGHTRHQAAKALGLTKVPVVVADGLTEREIEAYRIADNRTHDFTTWDLPELVEQLENLADDFSDVLGLEDWRTLVDQFNDMDLDLSDDAATDMGGNGFEITVVFKDKNSALSAELGMMDIPGVMDVRHKLKTMYGK